MMRLLANTPKIWRIVYLLFLFFYLITIPVAALQLPVYAARMPLLLMLFAGDGWMGWSILRCRENIGSRFHNILQALNLLPSAMLLVAMLSLAFISPVEWDATLRTTWMGVAIVLLIAKFLSFLIMKLYLALFNKRTYTHCKTHIVAGGSLAALFLGIMVNAMIVSERRIDVVEVPLNLDGLSFTEHGYRIVHVSDLHLGRWLSDKAFADFIHQINQLQPGMIVLTGDLVNYATVEALPYEPLLTQLKARDGVFTVLGNHDYGTYLRWPSPEAKAENMRELKSLFERIGWTLLNNNSEIVNTPVGLIRMAGTAHWCPRKKFRYFLNLESTFANDKASNVTILLTHSPQLWNAKLLPSAHHAHLTLAGHTHGLQLGFNWFGTKISPAALIFDHWAGLYYHNSPSKGRSYLYVNRGVGNVLIPFRLGLNAEITLIILNRT